MVPSKDRVYVDESGMNSACIREYGRALRGKQIFGAISRFKYARESFIAAKRESRIVAPLCYQGTSVTRSFSMYGCLGLPYSRAFGLAKWLLWPITVFHKSEESQQLIQKTECSILFLPPYSPDLNPIETFWANFKKIVSDAIDCSFLSLL
ncbi:MAG: transposase [Chlamydia sp.]